jgi:hypothetical protein
MSSSEFHHYTRDEFLAEFYPDPADKAAIAAGMKQLRAEQRAYRLAEMRRRLGITQAQVVWASPRAACPPSSTPNQAPPNCAPWPPTSKPSAAAWRSSPISATSGSPSSNLAPKQPDLISTRDLTGFAQSRRTGKIHRDTYGTS